MSTQASTASGPARLALRAAPPGAVLLAFALRAYRLDAQSLWADEGASAFMTGRSPGTIIEAAAADIHPPLYYLALRGWSAGAGNSEYALRFLSLMAGVLLVAVVFVMGKRLLGKGVGEVGALLVATAPFHIHYGQEARMYAQVAFLGTLSTYFLFRLLGLPDRDDPPLARLAVRPGRGALLLLGYVIAMAAALYTQYFAVALLAVHNLVFLAAVPPRRAHLRAWIAWGACQTAVGLVYLPWVMRVAEHVASWPGTKEPLTLAQLLRRVFRVYSFGPSWDATATTKAEALFAALLAMGLVYLLLGRRRPGQRSRAAFPALALYLVIPVAVIYILSSRSPMFDEKLLLLGTPPFHLLLASGIVGLASAVGWLAPRRPSAAKTLGALAVALLLLGATHYTTTRSLHAYYYEVPYARDDYRSIVDYIRGHSRPDDAIILNAPGQSEIFGYYYGGPLVVYPLPHQRPLEEEPTARELREIARKHGRAWVVLWAVAESDPDRFIQGWLGANAFLTDNQAFGNVELALYGFETLASARLLTGEPKADFGGVVTLARYDVSGEVTRSGSGGAGLPPGGMLLLRLRWQARADDVSPYSVFVHLVDQEGKRWAQQDGPPEVGAGLERAEQRGVLLPPDIPAGDYYLTLGIYDRDDPAQPLPVTSGGVTAPTLVLGPLKVTGAQGGAVVSGKVEVAFATIPEQGAVVRLAGYSISNGSPTTTLGLAGLPTAAPGEAFRLRLHWEALQQPQEDYVVFTHLLGAGELLYGQHDGEPAGGMRPTSTWLAGDYVADQHGIPVWLGTPPGRYLIEAGLYRRSGERLLVLDEAGNTIGDRVLLGQVVVTRPSHYPEADVLAPHHRVEVAFGNVALLGYNLGRPGDPPRDSFAAGDTAYLTLFWRALGKPQRAQPVVVEVRDGSGALVWRREQHPAGGSYPTSLWEAGEVVRDPHRWKLDLPPGSYELWVGLGESAPARLSRIEVREEAR